MERAVKGKVRKSYELTKLREEMQKEIFDLESDVQELEQCKDVLTTELTEEQAY